VLRTARLELLPFRPADADALHELFTDEGMRRWLLDDLLVPREWVDEEIAQSEARFSAGGCGLWVLREPPGEAPIGFVGFRPFWDPPELELVYGLQPARWGFGFATEAAGAAVAHAFEALGHEEVRAATDVPNTGSVAVLERLGFELWKRTDDGPQGTLHFRLRTAR
jgi:ribosomal-protein-alanine N-acetyltransferase